MRPEDGFIEHMGQLFERDNIARIAGRIAGKLLLAGAPMTLDELADSLQVSKASVSTNTRLLESLGILERLTYPGDRRDYYQVSERAHEHLLELRLQRFRATRELLREGLETRAAANDDVRARLELFLGFFDRMIESILATGDAISSEGDGG